MKKVLLWVCIVMGGIALIILLFSLFSAIFSIALWLLRVAGIVLLICFGVVAFDAVRERLTR